MRSRSDEERTAATTLCLVQRDHALGDPRRWRWHPCGSAAAACGVSGDSRRRWRAASLGIRGGGDGVRRPRIRRRLPQWWRGTLDKGGRGRGRSGGTGANWVSFRGTGLWFWLVFLKP